MTDKEKQLLLQELGMRLQYKPYIEVTECGKKAESYTVQLFGVETPHNNLPGTITTTIAVFKYDPENIKLYLRPLSSMTPEEQKEYDLFILQEPDEPIRFTNSIKFYLRKHFDFEGLIPMGLAIEAPEGMYN